MSFTSLTAMFVLLIVAAVGVAQPYDLSWNTIDGGGATSTGGGYELSGTIGQADAGGHAGGAFDLIGGFWVVALPVCTSFAPVDFDTDCDVDADDFAVFESCDLGPAVPHSGTPTCQMADLDDDNDVDGDDFGVFQGCYSGSGNPADPNCAD